MKLSSLRLKDFFSLSRYKSVSVYLLRQLLKLLEGKDALEFEQVHIIEQYLFRIIQCSSCVNQGSCVHCGCSIPAKMWVRTDHCSDGKWGEFMSEQDWRAFKIAKGLKFKIDRNDKV